MGPLGSMQHLLAGMHTVPIHNLFSFQVMILVFIGRKFLSTQLLLKVQRSISILGCRAGRCSSSTATAARVLLFHFDARLGGNAL
jgi:hypothetical protein